MIRLEHVRRAFTQAHRQASQPHWALDDISVSIGVGEVVGLLGANGAGKSTLMKIIMGRLAPTEGRVEVAGLPLDYPDSANTKAAQALIGYLPEASPTYPEMTVVDYLHFVAGMRGLPSAAQAQAVREVCAWTDLQSCWQKPIRTLSRGFCQRVGVAQALLHQPRILILDEPTNGLDPAQTEAMRQLIRQLAAGKRYAEQGEPAPVTILMSTHIMQEVSAVCDRVLLLKQGRLVVDEPLATQTPTAQVLLKLVAKIDKAALQTLLETSGLIIAPQVRVESAKTASDLPDGASAFLLQGRCPLGMSVWETMRQIQLGLQQQAVNVYAFAPHDTREARLAALFAGADEAGGAK